MRCPIKEGLKSKDYMLEVFKYLLISALSTSQHRRT